MFRFRSKKALNQFFVAEVLSNKPSPTRKIFVGQYSSLNSENEKTEILKTIANVNLATIQYINILRTISLSQETIQYLCFKKDSLAHKDPYTWNMQIILKFEKNFKILSKHY